MLTENERAALEELKKAQEKKDAARKEDLRLMGLMQEALAKKDYAEYGRLYPLWDKAATESIG